MAIFKRPSRSTLPNRGRGPIGRSRSSPTSLSPSTSASASTSSTKKSLQMESPLQVNKIVPKSNKSKKIKSGKVKSKEIPIQVRSAPASPVVEATKMDIEPIAIQTLPSNKDSDVASSSSSSPSSQDLTPSPAPSYTPAEQKFIDTIQSVSDRIDRFAFDLPSIDRQITRHLTKLCLYHWHPNGLSFDAEKLNISHKQLYYNAGMVDENVLQQIFRLDSIQTENDRIRKLRKAQVAKGNEIIKKSIDLRERLDRMKRFLPQWSVPKAEPIEEKIETSNESDKSNESTEAVEMMKDEDEVVEEEDKKEEVTNDDDDDDIETENLDEEEDADEPMKDASPKATSTRSPNPSSPSSSQSPKNTLSPLERKYAHLDLPTYSGPSFQARENPYTGVLVIEGDIDGIHPSDLSVTHDLKDRTLTIRGVRLPERRHSVQHPFDFFGRIQPQRIQPFGHFKKVIHLNQVDPHGILSLANLEAVVDPRQNKLQITLPRAQPQPTRQVRPSYSQPSHTQPTRSRAPVYTSSGYDYSSDDEPDHFSHPFGSFFGRPQPMRQQYVPALHPFGGFW